MSVAIYIQTLHQLGSDGEIASKWYKMEQSSSSKDLRPACDIQPRSAGSLKDHGEGLRCGKFLLPVFDGPAVGSCASVASDSRIYVIGGVEEIGKNYNPHLRPSCHPSDCLTRRMYCIDVHDVDAKWKEGPSMIKARGGHHAALVNDRIYVFGSSIRRWEEGDLPGSWSPWAECFDPARGQWFTLPNPPLLFVNVASGSAILDNGKNILVYCKYSNWLLVFDTEKNSWWKHSGSPGCYEVVTSMDGILYGAGRGRQGTYTVSAIDIDDWRFLGRKDDLALMTHDTPILGLIPIGKDVLCVLTGHMVTNDKFSICCTKYRISRSDQSNWIHAEQFSSYNYYLKDVISVEGCLSVPIPQKGEL